MVVRAVKSNVVAGYQLAVYHDKPKDRIQVILADLDLKNKWNICADGIVLSKHKAEVRNHLTSSPSTMRVENKNHRFFFF